MRRAYRLFAETARSASRTPTTRVVHALPPPLPQFAEHLLRHPKTRLLSEPTPRPPTTTPSERSSSMQRRPRVLRPLDARGALDAEVFIRYSVADAPPPSRAYRPSGPRLPPCLRAWPRTASPPRGSPARRGFQPRRRAGRAAARHPRDEPRPLRRGQERRARAPPPRGRRADRDRARDDEGRGDEARAGDELPRRRARAGGAPRGVPAQARGAARRGAEGALRRHAQGDRVRARREAERDLRRVRRGADRGRLDRPGLPGARCTTGGWWRSRSSTRASRPRCGRTCRTWG